MSWVQLPDIAFVLFIVLCSILLFSRFWLYFFLRNYCLSAFRRLVLFHLCFSVAQSLSYAILYLKPTILYDGRHWRKYAPGHSSFPLSNAQLFACSLSETSSSFCYCD